MTADSLADLAVQNLFYDVWTVSNGCVSKSGARVGKEPIIGKPVVSWPDNLGMLDSTARLAPRQKEMTHYRPGSVDLIPSISFNNLPMPSLV